MGKWLTPRPNHLDNAQQRPSGGVIKEKALLFSTDSLIVFSDFPSHPAGKAALGEIRRRRGWRWARVLAGAGDFPVWPFSR
jgi:hypothetical protein